MNLFDPTFFTDVYTPLCSPWQGLMPTGNDVMRPNYFCKSCKCYSIPSCPRETFSSQFLFINLFTFYWYISISHECIIIKIREMMLRPVICHNCEAILRTSMAILYTMPKINAVVVKLQQRQFEISRLTELYYVIRWPMSILMADVRTCSNFACGCSLYEDVYIHRTEFT